ncbi:MAG: hypothetical protein NZ480_05005 [Bdellovibrionaceae bacterium]|nr:hypothetical protein [Pseudobdellovibrionaceae bacterium]MDW8191064.1 hypothetical protein [Pseudobdellovibrionaceae bacterium]
MRDKKVNFCRLLAGIMPSWGMSAGALFSIFRVVVGGGVVFVFVFFGGFFCFLGQGEGLVWASSNGTSDFQRGRNLPSPTPGSFGQTILALSRNPGLYPPEARERLGIYLADPDYRLLDLFTERRWDDLKTLMNMAASDLFAFPEQSNRFFVMIARYLFLEVWLLSDFAISDEQKIRDLREHFIELVPDNLLKELLTGGNGRRGSNPFLEIVFDDVRLGHLLFFRVKTISEGVLPELLFANLFLVSPVRVNVVQEILRRVLFNKTVSDEIKVRAIKYYLHAFGPMIDPVDLRLIASVANFIPNSIRRQDRMVKVMISDPEGHFAVAQYLLQSYFERFNWFDERLPLDLPLVVSILTRMIEIKDVQLQSGIARVLVTAIKDGQRLLELVERGSYKAQWIERRLKEILPHFVSFLETIREDWIKSSRLDQLAQHLTEIKEEKLYYLVLPAELKKLRKIVDEMGRELLKDTLKEEATLKQASSERSKEQFERVRRANLERIAQFRHVLNQFLPSSGLGGVAPKALNLFGNGILELREVRIGGIPCGNIFLEKK